MQNAGRSTSITLHPFYFHDAILMMERVGNVTYKIYTIFLTSAFNVKHVDKSIDIIFRHTTLHILLCVSC